MPLFKRSPFTLAEPPKDLESSDMVYQVRYTKEYFQHYLEYLNRVNLYRQRVWTCKSTGKGNLTYEEALVSEQQAIEKVQELPNELLAPVLRTIQFSMLSLRDLADAIVKKLKNPIFVGAELYGRKNGGLSPCRVLKAMEDSADETRYEIGWLDRNRKLRERAILNAEDLVWKKTPFSRNFFKSFIRESTCRSIPWMLHENLVHRHGISTNPPEELQGKYSFKDGKLVIIKRKRKNKSRESEEQFNEENGASKRMKIESEKPNEDLIKYPIDDLLVQPGPDDPVFTDRPSPSREFNVPMDCVGNLLMVWDFCSLFGRLLHLSPFSMEDFENAICHKESNLVLSMEIHSALLLFLMKDNGEYSSAVQKRKRKPKISLVTWTEYLCDFLELINIPELCSNITTIKRGHYGLLDANAKLGILQELVNEALQTDLFREKLDQHIEQRQVLGASQRGEALEEARKKRAEKEQLKSEHDVNGLVNGHGLESSRSNLHVSINHNHRKENGDITEKKNGVISSSRQSSPSDDSGSKPLEILLKKTDKKQDNDAEMPAESEDSSGKEAIKQLRVDKKDTGERKSKEQRREYYEREMEKRIIRTNSLGKDRDYNRYWWFKHDGRIFVESSDAKQWGYYSSREELDALMGSLNRKGERERALHKQLEKFHNKMSMELQKRSKDLAHRMEAEEAVLRRSTRVRAPPRENPANAFLRYVNKWKED
ncbi:hypothetical protein SLA2020_209570 [Shorea laevis]